MARRLTRFVTGVGMAACALPLWGAVTPPEFVPAWQLQSEIASLALAGQPDEADWALRAAAGDALAQWEWANWLIRQSAEKHASARTLLQQSARAGYTPAMLQWGAILLVGGLDVAQDRAAGRAWIERAAQAGHAEAAFVLYRLEATDTADSGRQALDWLHQSAESGWVPARVELARLLLGGERLPRDPEAAAGWLERAAAQGSVEAQFALAQMLRERSSGARDDARALALYQSLADRGNRPAARLAADMIAEGRGAAPDPMPLRRFLETHAEAGNLHAAYELGLAWATGRFGTTDGALAQHWLTRAAAKDHPLALHELAFRLPAGSQRTQWLASAARLGYTPAEFYLGMAQAYGQGVPADDQAAVSWYRRAADKGYMEAQASLSWRYLQGVTLPQDIEQGLAWARKAAAMGHETSLRNLVTHLATRMDETSRTEWITSLQRLAERGHAGFQYVLGSTFAGHVPQAAGRQVDYPAALRWWRRAAAQSFAPAMIELGDAYASGRGVKTHLREAIRHYERAADLGEAVGELRLWDIYAKGRKGVARDAGRARRHLERAVWLGNAEAMRLYASWTQPGHPWRKDDGYDWARVKHDAQAGNVDAQVLLGRAYLEGTPGTGKSLANAHHWFLKAAAQGHAEALNNAGFIIYRGLLAAPDLPTARKFFERAARDGQLNAMVSLARMDELGEAGPVNLERARLWLETAAQFGQPRAIERLARAHERGELGLAADAERAATWRLRLPLGEADPAAAPGAVHDAARRELAAKHARAWHGDSTAFADVGMDHELGRGVPVNAVQAARWYRLGVERGESRAQYRLARLLDGGSDGVPREPEQALKLFRLAADQGHPEAQLVLYDKLRQTRKTPQDDQAAFQWIERAAASGDPEAAHRLGFHYLHGIGVARDPQRAYRINRTAAEQGHAAAQFNLALFHVRGEAVQNNPAEALPWLERAAEQAHPEAALLRAQLVLQGHIDAPRDTARPWLEIAARLSNAEAQYLLGSLLDDGAADADSRRAAQTWLEAAASQGHTGAVLRLAWGCEAGVYAGEQVCRDNTYEHAARQGHLGAQRLLAERALLAEPRDLARALYWLEAAAAQGDARANLLAGLIHTREDVQGADAAKSGIHLRAAAEQGDPLGQWLHGRALAEAARDPDGWREAVLWLERASRQGVLQAGTLRSAICAETPAACRAPASQSGRRGP